MSGHHSAHGAEHDRPAGPAGGTESFDHEINVRGIVEVGLWLAVVSIASFAIVYFFYRGLSRHERRMLDARPSPISEANLRRVPPGPQLQTQPERELAEFRARERARLNGWGWVDANKTVAHVPIELAIDNVAANGLPDFTPAPVAPPK